MFRKRFLSLCLAFIYISVFLVSCKPAMPSKNTNNEALLYLIDTYRWTATIEGNVLNCTYQGNHNVRTLLRARFETTDTETQDSAMPDDKYVIAAALFGALYQSMLSFDYETQFSLFYSDFPVSIFEEKKNRYTGSLQEALVKVAETSRDLNPFDTYTMDYQSEPVEMTVDEFLDLAAHTFPTFGDHSSIDTSLIEDVAALKITDLLLEFNDGLNTDDVDLFSDSPFVIYQYDGHWYIWQRCMDADLFYDLLGADPESNDYYKRCTVNDTVAAIRDHMIYLEGRTDAFFVGNIPGTEKISAGDAIVLNYYQGFGSRLNGRDGVPHDVYSAYRIEA